MIKWPEEHHRLVRKGYIANASGEAYVTDTDLHPISIEAIDRIASKYLEKIKKLPELTDGTPFCYKDNFFYRNHEKVDFDHPSKSPLCLPKPTIQTRLRFILGMNSGMLVCHLMALKFLQVTILDNPISFFSSIPQIILSNIISTHNISNRYLTGQKAVGLREDDGEMKEKMLEFCAKFKELGLGVLELNICPIKAAAKVLEDLSDIHPFAKNNGIIARAYMGVMLLLGNYPIPRFKVKESYQYAIKNHVFEGYLKGLIYPRRRKE